ncbi:MAG: putative DNA-binding domain-containing protein [Alphaproteobacteria bacterium]|nr:putative DNA-binding domain-containing protein [Alphaproteobacteria bacterium]
MPDLAVFQDAFAEALLAPEPHGRLARAPGFAVYRNTCAHGIVEALRAAFPTVGCLLGEEGFTGAALAFRDAQPPASPILSRYGSGFAGFLARQPWTSGLPYLADVALLDWLWLDAHLAADRAARRAPGVGADCFQPLRLTLHPAARFAWLDSPAVTIWLAHRCPGGFEELAPEWRPEGALVTRAGGGAMLQPIGRAEHRLLAAVAAGAPVRSLERAVGAGADLPTLIARLIACGALLPV